MMEAESDQTIDAGNPRRRGREQSGNDDPARWPGGRGGPHPPGGAHAGPRRDGRGAAGLRDTDRAAGSGAMVTAAGIRSRRHPPTGSGRPPSRGRTGPTPGRATAGRATAGRARQVTAGRTAGR